MQEYDGQPPVELLRQFISCACLLNTRHEYMYVFICIFQVEQHGAPPPVELLRQFIYYACLIYTHQECM